MFVFVHIPKTGGITFQKIINRSFEGHEIIRFFKTGKSLWILKDIFLLTPEERSQIKVMAAHSSFIGVRLFFKNVKYITFLRDPVNRIISDWFYATKAGPGNPLFSRATQSDYPLEKAVEECEYLKNQQARKITGLPLIWPDKFLLKAAKEALIKKFKFFGLTEFFNESIVLFKKQFRFKEVGYSKKENVNIYDKEKVITPSLVKTIERYNMVDIELYDFAKNLFMERIQVYGNSFKEDLETFRTRNRIGQSS